MQTDPPPVPQTNNNDTQTESMNNVPAHEDPAVVQASGILVEMQYHNEENCEVNDPEKSPPAKAKRSKRGKR